MKTNSFSRKLLKFLLIFVALICIASVGWVIFLSNNFPYGEIMKDITKEDAQSLVSFPICIPAHIPPGVDSEPEISSIADAVNAPEARDIILTYKGVTKQQETVIEVHQRYTEYEEMTIAAVKANPELAKVSLLNWMIPYTFFSEPKFNAAEKETQIQTSTFETDGTVWGLYEIVEPREYSSTMTTWIRNHVDYTVLSYLPAEEIMKITLSMFTCSDK